MKRNRSQFGIKDQLDVLQARVKQEKENSQFQTDLAYLYAWVMNFWDFKNSPIPNFDDSPCWCRSSPPEQSLESTDFTKCQFISCAIPVVMQNLAKSKHTLSSISLKDCFYCPAHNTLHVCSNENLFASRIFDKNNLHGIIAKHEIIIQPKMMSGWLVFGTCKYHLVHVNHQSDYDHRCVISKKNVSVTLLQLWENMGISTFIPKPKQQRKRLSMSAPTIITTTEPSTSKDVKPQKEIPGDLRAFVKARIEAMDVQRNTGSATILLGTVSSRKLPTKIDEYIIFSTRIMEDVAKAPDPFRYINQLLQKIDTPGQKPVQNNSEQFSSLLTKFLSNQRRKAMNQATCFSKIKKILHLFFYSQQRTTRHYVILEKKKITAVKNLRQYFSDRMDEKEMPIMLTAFTVFCSALMISPSESPALEVDHAFMNDIARQIYKQWIIICLSPYSLRGNVTIDFTSTVLAILFSMSHGGKVWGSQRVIHTNAYTKKYLCSPSSLEHFGFRKQNLTNGNNIIHDAYNSLLFNNIVIPNNMLEL